MATEPRTLNPWETEPNYAEGVVCGLPCFVRRNMDLLVLNGYVGVPEGHKYFGRYIEYDELSTLKVHRGVTFAYPGTHKHFGYHWWIGFDCAHAGDLVPIWADRHRDATYRDIQYVQEQCAHLAIQLAQGSDHTERLVTKPFIQLEYLTEEELH